MLNIVLLEPEIPANTGNIGPLADKFGRKPFLVINTLCMGLGLFLVYLSKDIYVYMIGGTLMSFMVSHDMQCVYILECSDEKSRARNYAIVKAVAEHQSNSTDEPMR